MTKIPDISFYYDVETLTDEFIKSEMKRLVEELNESERLRGELKSRQKNDFAWDSYDALYDRSYRIQADSKPSKVCRQAVYREDQTITR